MRSRTRAVGLGLLVCAGVALGARARQQLVRQEAPEHRLAEALDRYFQSHQTWRMYLQVDKPLYQPGETIHVRAFEVRTRTLGPSEGPSYSFQLQDPKGAVVARHDGPEDHADFPLADAASGGQYVLTVSSGHGESETRKLVVSQYETPRFKKTLNLTRKAYGPGDDVDANIQVRTATNAPFAGRDLEAVLSVDGNLQRSTARTDAQGQAKLHFTLPPTIDRGDAQLTVTVHDAGIAESVSERVPVILHKVQLAFYPEGGQLVRGLPGRIYFAATDPLGKPADVAGRVVDDHDETVANFRSVHDGLGRFAFRPRAGRLYHVELTEPAGIVEPFELPAVQPSGCVLATADDFRGHDDAIPVKVACSDSRPVVVNAFVRENRLATTNALVEAGRVQELSLAVPRLSGVVRVTLLSKQLEPLAERLVFHRLGRELKVRLQPDRPHYSPGDPVALDIETTDPAGHPVPASLALAVVDDTVLSLANDKTAHLRAHLLLERELADSVEDPDFYFSKDPHAPAALDALLGTRGWRRFVWQQLFYVPPPPYQAYKNRWRRMAPPPPGRPVEMPMPPMARGAADVPGEAMAAPAPAAMAEAGLKAEAPEEQEDAFVEGDRMKVREQAPLTLAQPPQAIRSDFRQTVYWNPAVWTNAHGHARVTFKLSDAVTSFRAVAEGASASGLLGTGQAVISATLPFYLDLKLPLEVSQGDRIDLPVTVRNGENHALALTLAGHFGQGLQLLDKPSSSQLSLAAGAGRSLTFPLSVGEAGKAEINLTASAGDRHDAIVRTLAIAPPGFPRSDSASGMLSGTVTQTFHLQGALPGSFSGKVILYPSPVATLVAGLDSMVREPVGCFEQASSANYPNVMVMRYLQGHAGADGALRQRTQALLARGYTKVTSYETPTRGYEWFGGSPGHEALSAYGLLEFADMKAVYPDVDMGMVSRTVQWLLGRRDGRGGFQRNDRALDSFGRASPQVTNAYIVYALCEAGSCGAVHPELESARQDALQSQDPYRLALAAKAELDADASSAPARDLVKRLVSLQYPDGSFHGTSSSITMSGGKSLDVETTSLAALTLLAADRFPEASSAVSWLTGQRDGYGGFGSTQATVLALKALAAYDQRAAVTPSSGELVVRVNGTEVHRAHFDAGRREPLELEGLGSALAPGDNRIELTLTSQQPMPYSIALDYSTRDPASSPDAPVGVTTQLDSESVPMGGTVRLEATVENVSHRGQPMTLARIGIPGGATFQLWQLKELVDTHQVDFFETRSREVILYFRSLPPDFHRTINLDLLGAIPGEYEGPASSAYLYYTAEKKAWASPLHLRVTPAA